MTPPTFPRPHTHAACTGGKYQINAGQSSCLDTPTGHYTQIDNPTNKFPVRPSPKSLAAPTKATLIVAVMIHLFLCQCLAGTYTDAINQYSCKRCDAESKPRPARPAAGHWHSSIFRFPRSLPSARLSPSLTFAPPPPSSQLSCGKVFPGAGLLLHRLQRIAVPGSR